MPAVITTPICPRGIEYHESERLTRLGGFLMIYGNQRRITMSAQLTDDEKRRGLSYLLDQLAGVSENMGLYLWLSDADPASS